MRHLQEPLHLGNEGGRPGRQGAAPPRPALRADCRARQAKGQAGVPRRRGLVGTRPLLSKEVPEKDDIREDSWNNRYIFRQKQELQF